MATDPALIVAVFGSLATVGTVAYVNRRHIHQLMAWAWGEERDETDAGAAGRAQTLGEKIDDLGEKMDDEAEQRNRDHQHVEKEIRLTRRLVIESTGNLVDALNDEVPEADLDPRDIEPDWYTIVRDGDDDLFPDGGPNAGVDGRGHGSDD